jgi:hypothetical protein
MEGGADRKNNMKNDSRGRKETAYRSFCHVLVNDILDIRPAELILLPDGSHIRAG